MCYLCFALCINRPYANYFARYLINNFVYIFVNLASALFQPFYFLLLMWKFSAIGNIFFILRRYRYRRLYGISYRVTGEWWVGKCLEGSFHGLMEFIYWHLPRLTEAIRVVWSWVDSVSAEIRVEHLPDTNVYVTAASVCPVDCVYSQRCVFKTWLSEGCSILWIW